MSLGLLAENYQLTNSTTANGKKRAYFVEFQENLRDTAATNSCCVQRTAFCAQGIYKFCILCSVFCLLVFFLALRADTSIIESSGRDSFEAATALFVIS